MSKSLPRGDWAAQQAIEANCCTGVGYYNVEGIGWADP